MTRPPPQPRLYPETVPGGSLIGSVNSRFAAAFTLYQQNPQFNSTIHSHAPTYTSFNSDFQPHRLPVLEQPSLPSSVPVDADLLKLIQNLSRSKIEALVTRAWIRNIPNQPEVKLRDLVTGALKKGILSRDDIYYTCANSFACLPTEVPLLETG